MVWVAIYTVSDWSKQNTAVFPLYMWFGDLNYSVWSISHYPKLILLCKYMYLWNKDISVCLLLHVQYYICIQLYLYQYSRYNCQFVQQHCCVLRKQLGNYKKRNWTSHLIVSVQYIPSTSYLKQDPVKYKWMAELSIKSELLNGWMSEWIHKCVNEVMNITIYCPFCIIIITFIAIVSNTQPGTGVLRLSLLKRSVDSNECCKTTVFFTLSIPALHFISSFFSSMFSVFSMRAMCILFDKLLTSSSVNC